MIFVSSSTGFSVGSRSRIPRPPCSDGSARVFCPLERFSWIHFTSRPKVTSRCTMSSLDSSFPTELMPKIKSISYGDIFRIASQGYPSAAVQSASLAAASLGSLGRTSLHATSAPQNSTASGPSWTVPMFSAAFAAHSTSSRTFGLASSRTFSSYLLQIQQVAPGLGYGGSFSIATFKNPIHHAQHTSQLCPQLIPCSHRIGVAKSVM